MKKYIIPVISLIVLLILALVAFYNYNVFSPGELLVDKGIEIEDIEIDEIIIFGIGSQNGESIEIKITDDIEIKDIVNEMMALRVKRDIIFELKMNVFSSANRKGTIPMNNERIMFSGNSKSNNTSFSFVMIGGTYIDISVDKNEMANSKSYSLVKIFDNYSYDERN